MTYEEFKRKRADFFCDALLGDMETCNDYPFLLDFLAVYSDLKKENAELKAENYALQARVKKLCALSIEDLPSEEWRDVKGYEGRYFVSNLGRVKSFTRKHFRLLVPQIKWTGYATVSLSAFPAGRVKTVFIHRLVAQAFIPNPNNKPYVNHKDGNKQNNCVDNLEWVTTEENNRHARENGLLASGTRHGKAVLTEEQVRYIRENPDKLKVKELCEFLGVSRSTVEKCKFGLSYKKMK